MPVPVDRDVGLTVAVVVGRYRLIGVDAPLVVDVRGVVRARLQSSQTASSSR